MQERIRAVAQAQAHIRHRHTHDAFCTAAAALGELLEDEVAAQALARDRQPHASAGHAEERPGRQRESQRAATDLNRIVDRRAGVVDLDDEAAGEIKRRDIHLHRAAEASCDADRSQDEEAFALAHFEDGRAAGAAEFQTSIRHAHANHALAVRTRGLFQDEVAKDGLTHDFERGRREFRSNFNAQIRPGRKHQRIQRRAGEGFIHRSRRVVHAELQSAIEANTGDVQCEIYGKFTSETGRRNNELTVSVRDAHRSRSSAEAQRHIGHRDTHQLAAAGQRQLLEGEIAAQGLTENREADARAIDPEIRTQWNIQRHRQHADRERLFDRAIRIVQQQAERSRERHRGNIHRHRRADGARDARRGDEEEARSIRHADDARRAVAERECEVGRAHANHEDVVESAEREISTSALRLLEREVAAQGLAEHAEADLGSFHAHIRTRRKIQRDRRAAHVQLLDHRRARVVDREAEPARERRAARDVADLHIPRNASGQPGSGNDQRAFAFGQRNDLSRASAQMQFNSRRHQADNFSAGCDGSDLFQREAAGENLATNGQRGGRRRIKIGRAGNFSDGQPHERTGGKVERHRLRTHGDDGIHRCANGVDGNAERPCEGHSRNVRRHHAGQFTGQTGARVEQGTVRSRDADQRRRSVTQREADAGGRHANRARRRAAAHLVEGEVAAQRLAEHAELDVQCLEARHQVRRCELDLDRSRAAVRNFDGLIDHGSRIVHAHRGRAGDGHAIDSQQANRARRHQREGAVRKLDQADSRVGQEDTGRQRIEVTVLQIGRTLPEEDVQVRAPEDAASGALGEAHAAFDGDEVRDVQRQALGKEGEAADLARAELHRDGAAVDGDGFVDGQAGGVHAEARASAHAHAARRHRNFTGEHTRETLRQNHECTLGVAKAVSGNREAHVRDAEARYLAAVTARRLFEEEVAVQHHAAHRHVRVERRDLQIRSGRQAEFNRLRTVREGFVHRRERGVDPYAERAGNADSHDRRRSERR